MACFAARPDTRFLHSLKLLGFRLRRMSVMTSFSRKPQYARIASNDVLSHHAIWMISCFETLIARTKRTTKIRTQYWSQDSAL